MVPASTSSRWRNAITGGTLDLGSGADSLTLVNAAANTMTIVNIETLIGGTGSDIVTLGGVITGGSDRSRLGHGQLTLFSAATNTVTLANIETVIGGTGDDIVTLSAGLATGATIDLGGGDDSSSLVNATANTADHRQCRNPDRRHGQRRRAPDRRYAAATIDLGSAPTS